MTKRIVSGIQTSGTLHLGNYLGSIKNWVSLQNDYESFVFLADLHSITVKYTPEALTKSTLEILATCIACGINPNKCTIFNQASVPQHSELAWIFNCITSMGIMNRMTQFKDKAGKNKEKASLGLYSYPVLMAADILLYNADIVPVGNDQKQHLELTRDIAENFNRIYDTNFFKLPEPYIAKESARIMSLKDGTKKMSKSDPSDYSRIMLTDDEETIINKIKKSKTDHISDIYFDKENRPEVSNLLEIYATLTNKTIDETANKYKDSGFANFKKDLTQSLIDLVVPISKEINSLMSDQTSLKKILQEGNSKAREEASKNLNEIKKLAGFVVF